VSGGGRSLAGSRGLVAFDVDGVLLRGLFLSRLAWLTSPWVWVRHLWLGFLLKIGFITVREAVERAYYYQRGAGIDHVLHAAESVRLARGAGEVCASLKQAGYSVVLVSAGVPQQVVEKIARQVGADCAYGVLLEENDGVLTGRMLGERHSAHGKRLGLEGILREKGLSWSDATVIVDDGSNLEIVEAAWRSIGLNPEWSILRRASFVLHTRNLREILEFFPEGVRFGVTLQGIAVRHEMLRKAIHTCAIFVPLIAAWSKTFALWLIGGITLIYMMSEALRLQGVALPGFAALTWRSMRVSEPRGLVWGPLLFGIGIWFTVAFFGHPAATAGVLILAIGDSAASLVGRAFGSTALPHNPGKTLVGSMALFGVGVIIAMFYVSLPWALAVGAVASVLESLPLGPADNLLLPIATAGMVSLALSMG